MKKLSTIIAGLFAVSVAFGQTNGSRPLDLSMLMLTLQSYQQTNVIGKTNGYVPLNSNALINPTFMFPGFTNAANGSFWTKSNSTLAPVAGLSISSNLLSISKVGVGQILTATNGTSLYGVKINNANDALVLKGGDQNRVYVANGNSFGAANSSYTNYTWSVSGDGAFIFPTGTIQNNLSMNGSSITNIWKVDRQNGLRIDFSNRTIYGYGNSISVAENLVVPTIAATNLTGSNAVALTYALNANSANQIYVRSYATNPWTAPQTFPSITLSNPLSIQNGGTGETNKTNIRTSLGLVIGTTIQAQSAILQTIADTTSLAAGNMMYWNGSRWTNLSTAATRTNLGLVISNNVQAYSPYLQQLANTSAATPPANSFLVWGSTNWITKSNDSARAAIGIAIGTNVQGYSSVLDGFTNPLNPPTLSNFLVGNGTTWLSVSPASARSYAGLGWAALTNTSAAQFAADTGLMLATGGGSGITNLQASNLVGTVSILNGGTGASSAATARTNLGVQAYSAILDGIANATNLPSTNYFLVGNGTNWISSSPTYARSAMGLGSAATNQSSDFATYAQGTLASTAVQPLSSPTFTNVSIKGVLSGFSTNAYIDINSASVNYVYDKYGDTYIKMGDSPSAISIVATNYGTINMDATHYGVSNSSEFRNAIGLGGGLDGEKTNITAIGTNYITNIITFSNGIITSWTINDVAL